MCVRSSGPPVAGAAGSGGRLRRPMGDTPMTPDSVYAKDEAVAEREAARAAVEGAYPGGDALASSGDQRTTAGGRVTLVRGSVAAFAGFVSYGAFAPPVLAGGGSVRPRSPFVAVEPSRTQRQTGRHFCPVSGRRLVSTRNARPERARASATGIRGFR